ncbi:DUF192 domain-containing protein [Noviherbaspirillum aridicola]|uniref:TadE-like domain-containing protein n=1 Tax=Noviherbaspirillum aridicola TaxID=2849687 RepID=A0ABQ4Q5S7_9BURK|nr:DUF192 domain-containing protein [Noviherbaspirillum aridicola]GIZ52342.1 hypothetical protein NCCP691_23560 [Noviherbaspirillum aridicola]
MPVTEALIQTRSASHPLRLRVANSFCSRFAGLMFKKRLAADEALLLTWCQSVHTAFMRFAIDLVYLDENGCVTKCVEKLKPWRCSRSSLPKADRCPAALPARHVLELAPGTIARLGIREGDRVVYPEAERHRARMAGSTETTRPRPSRQGGAGMVEFIVVGPILTMLGLSVLQYGMLFFAKNQVNHAGFMAARAGAMMNASVNAIEDAYVDALIPAYGGGTSAGELAEARQRARTDLTGRPDGRMLAIEMLNPTKESFDDWNDAGLQQTVGNSRRVIPNSELALRDPGRIGSQSGQSIHDANLIKLRITHAYEPKVPVAGTVFNRYLRWMDNGSNPDYSRMLSAGRIPLVTHVTLNMHSDAIEPPNPVSMPGPGNNGRPSDPGTPPANGNPPPSCLTAGCTVETPQTAFAPGDTGTGGGAQTGSQEPPPCM